MAGKIQHRRSISAKRALYEGLRIYHAEQVRPRTGQSFTAWINHTLAVQLPADYMARGEAMAAELIRQANEASG